MLKKYCISIIVFLFFGYAHADEKKWFAEIGWGIAPGSISGEHESMDHDNLHGVKNSWEAMHKFSAEAGYSFLLKDDSHLLTSVGIEGLVSSTAANYSAVFAKATLLYPVYIEDLVFNLGPKVKALIPISLYYEDKEDGRFSRKVEYDTGVGFALGVEAVWDIDQMQVVTGIEYVLSSDYEGSLKDSAGYANSSIDMNGVYLNIGLRFRF